MIMHAVFTYPLFSGPSYAMVSCKFLLLKTFVIMATNRFYSKTKIAAGSQKRQTLKRSCQAI